MSDQGFTILGKTVREPTKRLETFVAESADLDFVGFSTDEFTALCPVTGQPDYYTVYIGYTPGDEHLCLESKSLKLYLQTYRNVGAFVETLSSDIANDIQEVLRAKWLQVILDMSPRGGIAMRARTQLGSPRRL